MSERKKIALVYLGRTGGGPVYAYEMAKGLLANGAELFIFISKNVENYEKWQELKAEKIIAIRTYTNKANFIINSLRFRFHEYKRLKKEYKNLKVDACYLPMAAEHPWDRYIVNMLGQPQVISTIHDPIAHSSNNINSKLLSIATRIINVGISEKKPDDIIVLSKCFIDHIQKEFKIDFDRIHVIPHGIFDYYNESNTSSSFRYEKRKTNFLFFGRIDKYKGLDILAKAFKKVASPENDFALTIAGSGDFSPYSDLFKDINHVTIINRWINDDEVKPFFDSSANVVLVLPYIDATQSGVIPIAMSNNIPVIVSDAGGLVEQVEHGVTGFVFETKNIDKLSELMLFVASRDNSDIVRNANSYIHSLNWDVLAKSVLDIVKHTES